MAKPAFKSRPERSAFVLWISTPRSLPKYCMLTSENNHLSSKAVLEISSLKLIIQGLTYPVINSPFLYLSPTTPPHRDIYHRWKLLWETLWISILNCWDLASRVHPWWRAQWAMVCNHLKLWIWSRVGYLLKPRYVWTSTLYIWKEKEHFPEAKGEGRVQGIQKWL